jgi:hypothetical protein
MSNISTIPIIPTITNAQPVKGTIVNATTLKEVRAHARQAHTLVLGLQAYLDKCDGVKGLERGLAASAKLGAQQLKAINALPSDPAKLRQYVEAIKQKTQAIVTKLPEVKGFASFNNHNAIKKEADKALTNCEQFIAEYEEGKATIMSAKAA